MRAVKIIAALCSVLLLAASAYIAANFFQYRHGSIDETVVHQTDPRENSVGKIAYTSEGCPVVTIEPNGGYMELGPLPVLTSGMISTGRIGGWYLLQNLSVFKDGAEITGINWQLRRGTEDIPGEIVGKCFLENSHYWLLDADSILPLW